MTNQFESPAQAQFINTYVPIPFQEMMQAGAAKQERYEQGQARADALVDQYANIKVAPIDVATKNIKIKQINDEISNLVDQHPDLSSYEFRRKLNRYQRDIASDSWWNAAQGNVKPYEELVKSLAEGRQKNVNYNTRQREQYFKMLHEKGTQGLLDEGLNNGSIVDPGAIDYNDFNKYIDDSLGKVKESGALNQFYDESGMKITKGNERVTMNALRNAAKSEMDSFYASNAGKNFVNYLAASKNDNLTMEDLEKGYNNLIEQRADKFVHGTSTNKVDYDEGYSKKLKEDKFSDFDLTGEAVGTGSNIPDYSKYANPILSGNSGPGTNSPSAMSPVMSSSTNKKPYDVGKVGVENPQMAKRIGKIQGKYNLDKDKSITSINNNLNYWLGPQFNNYNILKASDAKELSNRYFSNLQAVQIYDTDGNLLSGDKRKTLTEGSKDLSIGSIVVDPKSKGENAYFSSIITKSDGTTQQINLALPRQLRGAGKMIAKLEKLKNDAILEGKSQKDSENLGNGYTMDTEITYEEAKTKDGFVMLPSVVQTTKDNTGKVVRTTGKIPYEEYKSMTEDELMKQLNDIHKK